MTCPPDMHTLGKVGPAWRKGRGEEFNVGYDFLQVFLSESREGDVSGVTFDGMPPLEEEGTETIPQVGPEIIALPEEDEENVRFVSMLGKDKGGIKRQRGRVKKRKVLLYLRGLILPS